MLGPGGAMTSGGSMPGMSGMSGMPGMSGMMSDMSGKHRQHMADMEKVKTAPAAEADRLFLRTMTEHLKMGVDLGKQAKRGLRNAEVREFAAASNTALARDLDDVKKLERVKPAGK